MKKLDASFNAHWLRHASPFINQHRGRTFVALLTGEVLDHDNAISILHDLVLLHSLGVRLILVHGSRPQIDSSLAASGMHSEFIKGRRITSPEAMPLVAQAAGQKRFKLEARLTTDIEASPMRGAKVRVVSGNFIIARPMGVIDGIDHAYSGEVRKVDKAGIRQALDADNVVLVSHIGFSRTGEMFNLSSAEVACEVAIALNADKLIVFSENEGILKGGKLLRQIDPNECRVCSRAMANHVEASLLESVAHAAASGVERAHVVSYVEDGALLKELFTRDGSGTLVSEQELETLRDARPRDAGRLLHILRPLENDGTLVKRPRKTLEREIEQFMVIEKENLLIGCAALYPFVGTDAGELACLAVRPEYRSDGRGDRLLRAIEARAFELGLSTLFVLTTQTAHWFVERGFKETAVAELPSGRGKPYNLQRNSKIFKKQLG